MDIKAGNYRAKAIGGVWTNVGAKGTPCVAVNFEFESAPGSKSILTHRMFLTQTPLKDGSLVIEHTMDTLIGTLGYLEDKDLLKDSNGNLSFDQTFLSDKEVEIVVELEADQNDPKKMYPRVRWVNELSGNRLAGLPIEKVLGNANLKALAAAARARMGISAPAPKSTKTDEMDIPF